MNKSNVLIGVLAGAATGVLLGILFAPDKGSETRKKIANAASDSAGGLKQKFQDLMADVSSKFEETKNDPSMSFDHEDNKPSDNQKEAKTSMV